MAVPPSVVRAWLSLCSCQVRRSSIKARTSEVGVASEELTAPTKARVSMELSVSPLTSTPGRLSLSRALSQRVLDMGNVEDIERAVQADAENMSNLDSARGEWWLLLASLAQGRHA